MERGTFFSQCPQVTFYVLRDMRNSMLFTKSLTLPFCRFYQPKAVLVKTSCHLLPQLFPSASDFSWYMSDCFQWPFYLQQLFTLTFYMRHVSSLVAQNRNLCYRQKRKRGKQGLSLFQTCQPTGNEKNAPSRLSFSLSHTRTHKPTTLHIPLFLSTK